MTHDNATCPVLDELRRLAKEDHEHLMDHCRIAAQQPNALLDDLPMKSADGPFRYVPTSTLPPIYWRPTE